MPHHREPQIYPQVENMKAEGTLLSESQFIEKEEKEQNKITGRDWPQKHKGRKSITR
jgi:hypothetical protein